MKRILFALALLLIPATALAQTPVTNFKVSG
jgi:hypothetical protein